MEGKMIIAVIVAWVGYKAINKWIWTPMKRGPNPIHKEDNDPPSLPSSSVVSLSSPPPPKGKEDAASLPSSSVVSLSSPPPPKGKEDAASLPSSSAEVSSSSPPPPEGKEDAASLPSSSAEVSSSSPPPPEGKEDATSLPSSSAEVSSSSPPPLPGLEYDVFLSFRGRDTRTGILSHLHAELQYSGIKTFMDAEELEPGTEISSNLLTAIKESRSAIVLLSPNYASSSWCLDELANIVQGWETRNTIVLPVFYNVEPRDVRHQMGVIKEAFTTHEQRYSDEKVKRWKDALTKVANLSGLESKTYGSDRQLVEGIVQCVCNKVRDLEIESPGDFVEFEATRKAMAKVMKALKDDGLTAIGIYGTGGIGKTTMAKQVAAEAKRKGLFRHVVMAVVTHKPDLENIQGALADQLGVKLEKETIVGRAGRLSKEIMSRNKILVILDDIWDVIDLSSVGIPSYEKLQDCNSKVLLTTRRLDVCNSMDSQPNIALSFLSEEDSWNLFVKKTRMSSKKLTIFNDVARIVARECAGLPIALVAIARALGDKEMNEWKEAAERLKSAQPSNHDDVVFNCIKLSYDQLTSEDAKLCFLLCCLFPEDYDIQIEELMTYGIGKGLFRQYNTLQEARTICRSAVRSLKSSSLLLGTKHDGKVRMHDVIRDVARLISSSEDGQSVLAEAGRRLTMWPKIKADMGYCAISLMMNEIRKLPKKLVCSKLKILLLQHNPYVNTIPDSFLECLNELRVLDLSNTSISSLPPSFSLLNNLHTLYLDSCEKFSDISVLGKLEKLEILSLRECCPQEVPEEIGHLTSLRMLDISESQVVKIASKVISRLSELEELYMQCDFADWRNEVEEAGKETNVGFDELTGLSYLHILKVGIPDTMVLPTNVDVPPKWLYFDICISRDFEVRESTWKPHSSHDHSRTLTLSTTIHTLPEWFIDVVTEKAEKLQYRKCKGLDNILVEYDRGRLNELRHLSIIGPHENLKEVMNADSRDSNNAAFPKLEELHLLEVENINKLCVGKLPPRSLCNLKLLDVRKCHNLVNALLQSPLLERLQYLEKLVCAHMQGLEFVFGSGKTTTCKKLQEMRLWHLPKLIKIWSGHASHAIFFNLKLLAVSGCKKLKSLFTSDVAHCLSQLEDLWVHSCFSLDRIVEESKETGKRNVIFPKLKNLVLEDLPRLRRLYSNSSGGPTSLDIKFPSLEHFHTRECPRFSPSAFKFHSQKQVHVNDLQQYSFLKKRLWENIELVSTISKDGRRQWQYDVFLTFMGEDTPEGFTYELYDRLQNKRGINTFMYDQDLKEGNVISPSVLNAIEESKLAIVIFSPLYASSIWCLEELRNICECMEDNRVRPFFYKVDPTDVRYQKRSFEDAFTTHENSRRHGYKVDTWRDVLNHVTNLSGWHTKNYKTERELVDAIVDSVSSKVQPIEIEFALSTGDFEAFESRRKAMNEVMEALTDDEVTAVGVCGMGGVGKTTMAIHVAAQACKNGTFHHVIMAVLSQISDLRKIQGTLADMLGVKLEEESEFGRAARLNKEIMRREKILIILDDMWERIDLPSIGIPSQYELQNCNIKVLLTTRSLTVCHVMRCQAIIQLEMLSEEDSWSLFVKTARREFESTLFHNVARKVARECYGLPIALVAIARALGDKDLAEWQNAAQRLEKRQIDDMHNWGAAAICIKSSYDYLKDEDSKSCFLLCCLFPEDYDIPIEDLFRYAIGKGLFQDSDRIKEARVTADKVVKYLKDSNLLIDSVKHGCVRMHDIIRATGMMIARSEDGHGFWVEAGCGLQDWPRGLPKGYSAVSLMENDIRKLPEELVCPKLQILLLQGNSHLEEIPEAFFQSSNALRVLDLSHTSISALSLSLSLQSDLRGLYLDFCQKILDITILKRLKKLEILSMRYTCLEELPREIGHLTNLRMLDVTGGLVNTAPSNVISRLHRLEELHMQCEFFDWGSKFDELTGLLYLSILKVCISDAKCLPETVEFEPNWVYFDICISRIPRARESSWDDPDSSHVLSRALTLDTTINTLPDWFIRSVTQRTEKLRYLNCKGLNNILDEYGHGRLHCLKYLSVIDCHETLKQLMNPKAWDPNEPVFENLEMMHLDIVGCLEELCVGELPPGSLSNLKSLKVEACHNLVNAVLSSNLLQRLHNLDKLVCSQMDGMKYVFGCEGLEPGKIILTKLREMKLMMLENLASIGNGPSVPRHSLLFHNLKILVVVKCPKLRYLFTSDVARSLLQLEDLWVQSCDRLERVIEATEDTVNYNHKIIVFPELRNLVLEDLPDLTGFYNITTGSATSLDVECPSLQHMYVNKCPHFSPSASDFHSRNQVQVNDDQHYRSLTKRFIAVP